MFDVSRVNNGVVDGEVEVARVQAFTEVVPMVEVALPSYDMVVEAEVEPMNIYEESKYVEPTTDSVSLGVVVPIPNLEFVVSVVK